MPKKYEIEGGRWVTVSELAKELGQDKGLVAMRLSRGIKELKKLKKPRNKYKQRFKNKVADGTKAHTQHISEAIKGRMYFDPLGHWKLIKDV
jgi:hypothetical protein